MSDPEPTRPAGTLAGAGDERRSLLQGLRHWLRALRRREGEASLRDAIEELIEENEGDADAAEMGSGESGLILNILKFGDVTVRDIMVPRADILAVPNDITLPDLVHAFIAHGHSRLPVYRETLDDTIGMIHIKDALACKAGERAFDIGGIKREVLFAAPSMRAIDLLLQMRLARMHMALVVDEFGGVDGLVTIEDVVEEIVGEIEDEHDVAERPKLIPRPDGTIIADARATIAEFEQHTGPVLTEEERAQDIDTLGGLVTALAGRVPSRGELIGHPSGIAFEILDADPRRVKRVRLRLRQPPPPPEQ
jgi:CBS domain containing-hemolysin-like protein